MTFDIIWAKIKQYAGDTFYTKTGLPFTYKIVNDCVVPDRTNYPLTKKDFNKASDISDLVGPGQISGTVRGPSYVYAILSDSRII